MFQFTHPGRGATSGAKILLEECGFNSRTPGGVRLAQTKEKKKTLLVSIHAPREGCDLDSLLLGVLAVVFQFTHPGRGATMLF